MKLQDILDKGWELVGSESFQSYKTYTVRKYIIENDDVMDGYDEHWWLEFSISQGVCNRFANPDFNYENGDAYTGTLYYARYGGRGHQDKKKLCSLFRIRTTQQLDALELIWGIPKTITKRARWYK